MQSDDAGDTTLADEVAQFYADPLGFVMFAYPWGERGGPLENYAGPDDWQREFLVDLGRLVRERKFDGQTAVAPIRMAAASGHGIGKGTLSAWLCNWIMSTRPGSQGTVTANTFPQLQTKTWASIQRWTKLCITGHWFRVTGDRIVCQQAPESWFCSAQTCREENSEAFAGQHAATSTSWYLFDESSAIPHRIWEVAEGGLTDGEPMLFAFGNPTRSSGRFYQAVFGSERARWNQRVIDSEKCKFTNKELIAQWIADYGEDSDFVRVRVRGLPPRADELQYIDTERIQNAQRRQVETLPDEPLICGLDVSGGGAAWSVFRFRRGLDAACLPRVRFTGEQSRDRSVLIAKAAEILADRRPGREVAMMFVDSAFGAAIVERLHTMGYRNVVEVNFGGPSGDHTKANARADMWSQMKDWLLRGRIDDDMQLELGLAGPGYHVNRSNRLVLESKQDMQRRGVASPDDADALALTFAAPVAPRRVEQPDERYVTVGMGGSGWME